MEFIQQNWYWAALAAVSGSLLVVTSLKGGRGISPAQATMLINREDAIVVAVPSGSAGKITTQIARPDPLVAPYTKGQAIGTLKVMLGDQSIGEVPLVALEAVEQAGILGRAWDAIRLWIK